MTKVKIERWKNTDFILNYTDEYGKPYKVTWRGAKGGKPTLVEVDNFIYEYLAYFTKTFESGELRVSDLQENKEEVIDIIVDKEAYENNSKTRDEIIVLLKGNMKKLEKEMNTITDRSAKSFFYDVFTEIKEELVGSKIELVEKWIGNIDEE